MKGCSCLGEVHPQGCCHFCKVRQSGADSPWPRRDWWNIQRSWRAGQGWSHLQMGPGLNERCCGEHSCSYRDRLLVLYWRMYWQGKPCWISSLETSLENCHTLVQSYKPFYHCRIYIIQVQAELKEKLSCLPNT